MGNAKTSSWQTVNGPEPITKGMAKANALAGKAYLVPAQGNKQGLSGSLRDLKKAITKTSGGKGETTGMIKAARLAFNGPAPAQQGNSQKISGSIRDLKKAIEIAKNVETRTSGLQGRAVGAMDHMGGHGLTGGIENNFGGGGLNEFNK